MQPTTTQPPDLQARCDQLTEQLLNERERAIRAEKLAATRLQTIQEADAETTRMHDERNAAYTEVAHLRRELAQAHAAITAMAISHYTATVTV